MVEQGYGSGSDELGGCRGCGQAQEPEDQDYEHGCLSVELLHEDSSPSSLFGRHEHFAGVAFPPLGHGGGKKTAAYERLFQEGRKTISKMMENVAGNSCKSSYGKELIGLESV